MNNNELPWTGERLVTSIKNYGAIEHIHRYTFASEFINNNTIVADIASGEGYGTNILALKAKMAYGIDISNEAIIHANNKYGSNKLKFIEGSAHKIPLETSTIDVVISFETLEHIIQQEEMLSEIKRILKKDGILIMSTPEKSNYQDKQVEKNHFHIKELYFNDFKHLIEKHFDNILFYKQKFLSASIIVPFENSDKFKYFNGDYENVTSSNTIDDQTFNICVASNILIKHNESSLFALGEFQSDTQNLNNQLLNSKYYRLGRSISLPYRIIKRIFS